MPTAALAVNLLLSLLDRATQISALLKTAHAEGRDVSQDELSALVAADDAARAELQKAIDAAK